MWDDHTTYTLVASLLLVAMPFAPCSFLLLVVIRPGAPSGILAPTQIAYTYPHLSIPVFHSTFDPSEDPSSAHSGDGPERSEPSGRRISPGDVTHVSVNGHGDLGDTRFSPTWPVHVSSMS